MIPRIVSAKSDYPNLEEYLISITIILETSRFCDNNFCFCECGETQRKRHFSVNIECIFSSD